MKICSVCQRCYEDEILSCIEEDHDRLITAQPRDLEIIPNYRLEFLHQTDAAGETYRVVNTILRKNYLIKIIAPEMADENARREFLREAQALSVVIHPNVTRVFESGTLANGSLYVVTEYLAAQTLRECLENVGKPSEVTALAFARQTAEALTAIHAAGVLHRNVRPENIVLTTDEEKRFLVKLQNVDFGAIEQNQANQNAEQNLERFKYYSPEQCAARAVDAQTDVYSLGVVLYEMLAGNVPFDSPYADALIAKQISEPAPPVKINSFDLRMLLTHTLSDTLQKTTLLRLKTSGALARQLRHIEQLATHSSTPPPAVAYPASMNKQAQVFAPPVKIEKVEAAPAIKEEIIEPPVIVEPSIIEEIPLVFENQAALEDAPEIELPVVTNELPQIEIHEDLSPTEIQLKDLPAADVQPIEEEMDEEETSESAPFVFIDYTTTKLPPIDLVVENSSFADESKKQKNIDVETTGNSQIPVVSLPVLVEWQQPDDVPTTTQTLSLIRKETADTIFRAPKKENAEEKIPVIEAQTERLENESPNRRYESETPVFSSYDTGSSWSLPAKRKLVTGAVIVGLLVIAISGTFLNRQIQLARTNDQSAVKPSTTDKTLPKTAEPLKSSESEKSPTANPENLSVNNPTPNNASPTDLPNYQPRETEEKTVAPVVQTRSKNRAVKNSAPQSKNVETEVFDKKGNVRPSIKETETKNQTPKQSKTDVITRPRIVKNPRN